MSDRPGATATPLQRCARFRAARTSFAALLVLVACGGEAEQSGETPGSGRPATIDPSASSPDTSPVDPTPAGQAPTRQLLTEPPATERARTSEGGAHRIGVLDAGGDETFARFSHVCAAVDDSVQCWGANGSGQLGDGMPSAHVPLPVRVDGTAGEVSALAAGGAHTCAIVSGTVLCWGHNGTRQLGAERPSVRVTPGPVEGLPAFATALGTGRRHTCAVSNGEVWCWGASPDGELGSTPAARCRGVYGAHPCTGKPVRVPGLPVPAQQVALGDAHSCALASGQVLCWGAGGRGQLGDGLRGSRASPAPVALPAPARHLAAGSNHTCATLDDGVWCWGANEAGQLGSVSPGKAEPDDPIRDDRDRPVRVEGLGSAPVALGAGGSGTCAVLEGDVFCWGAVGSRTSARPERVAGLAGRATHVSVGADNACAVVAGARIVCWGDNDYGQLGNGAAPRSSSLPALAGPFDDGRIRDANGDGSITVACLGDSNTHRAPSESPGWCERLGALLTESGATALPWRTVNRGWGGASAIGASLRPARQQLRYSLENDQPDVVLMAYGTNDLLGGAAPGEVLLAYAQHRQRVRSSGAVFFVATTPPTHPPGREVNVAIQALDELILASFPADRVIDFHSGVAAEDLRDGIHLSDSGHERRARAAAARLSAAAPVTPR